MVGLEDEPTRCAEICIFEVFGEALEGEGGRPTAAVGMGVHPFRDAAMTDEFAAERVAIDVAEFHVYAADWRPGRVDFLIDDQHVKTVHQAPDGRTRSTAMSRTCTALRPSHERRRSERREHRSVHLRGHNEMTKVTCDMATSVDGFVAGPNQSLAAPFGDGVGDRLHRWMFEEPEANAAAIEAIGAAGAYVMGRNMFGPGRGAWDEQWKGWWGDEPPYHAPVFVLTHHPREPVAMQGATTFTFVTDGIESALAQAREAAGDADVAIAGGAETVNQYLSAGLIDELRLHVVPVVLGGAGERLFDGVGELSLERLDVSGTDLVTHLSYRVVR
jgi:dihydrofolate reductase